MFFSSFRDVLLKGIGGFVTEFATTLGECGV